MSRPVGVRPRRTCSSTASEGAWGAEAAESQTHHTASDSLSKALESALGEFEHIPANPRASSDPRIVQQLHASGSSATSRSASTASAINAKEDLDPIKSVLADYDHVPVGKHSWNSSQQTSESPVDQSMPAHLPPQEKISANHLSMHPTSKSLAGCGGNFSRFQESGSVHICLANFRQHVHPAELASPTTETVQSSGRAGISSLIGVDTDTLHELRNITTAMEQALQMHAAMFPANGTPRDTCPHLTLIRQAIFERGAEEFMMVLIHAHTDMAWWSERYHLYSKGLITKCQGHLGHSYPSVWTWDKVRIFLRHANVVNRR